MKKIETNPSAATPRTSTIDRRDFLKVGAGGAFLMTALNAPAVSMQTASGQSGAGAGSPVGSIDAHSHWEPQTYSKALAGFKPGTRASTNPLDFDLEKRIQWMDQRGVQMVVLTLSGAMPWQSVHPDEGDSLARILNDAAVEAHLKFPERFIAGVEMPITDPQLSLKELNRVAGKPGLRAAHLPNSLAGRDYIFEPEYEPLLARCEELGYPLLFHPLVGDENIYGGKERLGNPLAKSANIHNTLGGGIL